MNSPRKKLDQSVFDGLPSEYKFAAVDSNSLAWAYEQRPYVKYIGGFSFDGMCRSIPGSFDATDWKNSLIEREDLEGTNQFDDYLKSLREIVTMTKQRDELLSILQRLEAVDFGEHWNSDAEQAAIAARALIRKFEVESGK